MDINTLVRNSIDRIVAVEPGDNGTAEIFRRLEDGSLQRSTVAFKPWLLVSTLDTAKCISTAEEVLLLNGEGIFHFRILFPDVKAYETGLKELKQATGKTPSATDAPYRVFSDFTQQFLSTCPARLFGKMRFSELRRLQLDIETRSVGEPHFPDATRPDDKIFMVSLKDNTGWEDCLVIENEDEKDLLSRLVKLILQRDPDVIEGHNIFNFDLKYITQRCKLLKVKFAIGRNGSEPSKRESRFTAGERITPFTRFDIYGRHVIDTLHLVFLYDAIHRDMDSHGLKFAAKYFNVASPERTYLDAENITNLYRENPMMVRDYCLDDVRETDALSRILSPSFFYQAQLIPYSYQSCVTRGNATRIDAMLCAEYILENAALPVPHRAIPIQGALTEGEKFGVFRNVWHVDVRSLYPSIIASRKLSPENDGNRVFLRLLTGLRQFRLEAKDARRNAPAELRAHFDALQSTFKILINAFYGYTAFEQGTFNDYQLAATITATGRGILSGMRDFLLTSGADVIEMDTDGIYFIPPPGEEDVAEMQQRIQATLPEGIEIEIDETYEAMFGYKSKNYALLHHDGKIGISGAALKSRGLEAFQRKYIQELIALRLKGQEDKLEELYQSYVSKIEAHKFPISDFAKREYLSTNPKIYADKLAKGETKHSAAYDLALASGEEYKQGDAVDFYVTGSKKNVSVTENSKLLSNANSDNRDENIPFYINKLSQLHKKLTTCEEA